MLTGVADPHHVDADLVPTFYFDADVDPTFHFDASRDPDPAQSDANLYHWHTDRLRSILSVHGPSWPHFEPLQLLKLIGLLFVPYFDADPYPDPGFHTDADPDPPF
jgi:hypothetical protein